MCKGGVDLHAAKEPPLNDARQTNLVYGSIRTGVSAAGTNGVEYWRTLTTASTRTGSAVQTPTLQHHVAYASVPHLTMLAS